jgi:hypothetical protein
MMGNRRIASFLFVPPVKLGVAVQTSQDEVEKRVRKMFPDPSEKTRSFIKVIRSMVGLIPTCSSEGELLWGFLGPGSWNIPDPQTCRRAYVQRRTDNSSFHSKF